MITQIKSHENKNVLTEKIVQLILNFYMERTLKSMELLHVVWDTLGCLS